jgi:hypothetical protein
MSFDKRNVKTIAEDILQLIDDEHLFQRIDEPIEKAFSSFKRNLDPKVTSANFLPIVGRLVQHIFRYGLTPSQTLSEFQACVETLSLLEQGYDGGYYAAFLDAIDWHYDGLETVLCEVVGFITTQARERYRRWICSSRIVPLDWSTKCQLAEILLKRLRSSLPVPFSNCPPSQLAAFLPELIEAVQSTNRSIRNTMGADINLHACETSAKILPLFKINGPNLSQKNCGEKNGPKYSHGNCGKS